MVAAECPFCGAQLIDDITRILNFEFAESDLFDRPNFAWTEVSRQRACCRLRPTGPLAGTPRRYISRPPVTGAGQDEGGPRPVGAGLPVVLGRL